MGRLKVHGQHASNAQLSTPGSESAPSLHLSSDVTDISARKRGSWTCEPNLVDGLQNRRRLIGLLGVKDRLLTVADLYPEIVSGKGREDDQPSCSAAEALTRQEPFINQNLAYQALGMLTQLLRHGCISYQGGFCDLSTDRLTPLPIRVLTACPHRIELRKSALSLGREC